MAIPPSLFLHVVTLIFMSFSPVSHIGVSAAGDASQNAEPAPISPGCNVTSQDVLIKNWINGNEKSYLEGQSARFGASLPISLSKAIKLPAALANPFDSCTKLSSKVSNSIVIAKRGNCNYEDKAKIAESCGAAALLVINDDEDTPVMVCTQNDTPPNISMPVVMIPKSAGDSISVNLSTGSKVDLLLYSPIQPILDIGAVICLALMAVGTIVSASVWDEFTSQPIDDNYDQLERKAKMFAILSVCCSMHGLACMIPSSFIFNC
ncbi:signal peptide peptidase-like 2 [Zingiber officinale]|uniref:signal peptide peptidase-like 2 n=1 Tax=Zingiber officinale TaxID=94328 RepID=UPI001C4D938F|nr:signal peptide peptidase-like 2 [Zingiber officinale]